jgi:hypothetical protein
VSTAEEYRSYAEECLGWARAAKSESERAIFIQMSKTWFAAAIRASARDRSGVSTPLQIDLAETEVTATQSAGVRADDQLVVPEPNS